jgi:hypothetical protein
MARILHTNIVFLAQKRMQYRSLKWKEFLQIDGLILSLSILSLLMLLWAIFKLQHFSNWKSFILQDKYEEYCSGEPYGISQPSVLE